MPLPLTNHSVPFNVTRFSHVVLHVRDLDESRGFYEELIGLIVTERDGESLYLRGVEETCHHSLVLRRATGSLACERIGFRVLHEDDLDRAKKFFDLAGRDAEFVEVPHQGRTLRLHDAGGIPVEMCAHMPVQRREIIQFASHRGAAPTRIDHAQAHVADISAAADFYGELGFRVSEYASRDGTDQTAVRSIFLTRKGNANDIVLLTNLGPRLHHLAHVVHDASTTLLRVCDLAASKGMGERVEWGPNRHGLGYEQFLYLLDPDGHRVELLSPPYQLIDLEDEPYGWSTEHDDIRNLWGPDPPESWLSEATHFYGIEPKSPVVLEAALPDASRAHHSG
jgi:catechol 2,3-dioxygenase